MTSCKNYQYTRPVTTPSGGPQPARTDRPREAALRVLRELVAADGPATLAMLTQSLGGHPNTTRMQLEHLVALPARAWLVTRTPVSDALHTDHAVVQPVPPVIYRASYPAWIFPAASFASFATAHRLSLVWHRCTDGHFTLPGLAFDFRTAVFYSREIGFPPPPAALA